MPEMNDAGDAPQRGPTGDRLDDSLLAGAARRLYARRWMLLVACLTLFALEIAFALPFPAVLAALSAFAATAAFAPRDGIVASVPPGPAPASSPRAEAVVAGVLRGVPDPAVVLTSACNVLLFNDKAADVIEDLMPGRHLSGVIRHPKVLDAVTLAKEGAPPQTVAYVDRVPVERHFSATISWIGASRTLSASDPAILIVLRDLTEQERLDQMRADFVAYASHELKTPLASVIGFIETLQGRAKDDPEARARFLDIMLRQAKRMARLIENLLSLSRVEMRAHLKPETIIDLNEVVQHAVQSLEPLASANGIRLEAQELSGGATILGDWDEMAQVFQNLIHNALKYGRDGGFVRVRVARLNDRRAPGRIAVTVEDDGLGIAPQHLPRLTERFYRVEQGAAADRTGTGLGLAIASQVIARHRGELKIASMLGEGSAFTVVLAEHKTGAASRAPAASPPAV
ncbi:MAG: ATP-binding protein [Hyphomicrobiales bacterium]|nr:ATP-binding protein [Hyphomicrobiales bacterium]